MPDEAARATAAPPPAHPEVAVGEAEFLRAEVARLRSDVIKFEFNSLNPPGNT